MSETKKTAVAVETDKPLTGMETLEINGSVYETTLPAKYKDKPAYKPQNPNHVSAFMPGTVRKFFVAVGDRVSKGDKLLVLDAMKMNNELLAPVDGIVEKIAVKVGESVPKHTLLVALKTPAAGKTGEEKPAAASASKAKPAKQTAKK